jgi:hypothetical protein
MRAGNRRSFIFQIFKGDSQEKLAESNKDKNKL